MAKNVPAYAEEKVDCEITARCQACEILKEGRAELYDDEAASPKAEALKDLVAAGLMEVWCYLPTKRGVRTSYRTTDAGRAVVARIAPLCQGKPTISAGV